MADMRKYAGGGPEAMGESMAEETRRPTPIDGRTVDYSSGVARMIPTPEEARRAQEAARRAQSIAEQSVSGWGGSAEALHRAAREEAARQIAAEPLLQSMYGQAHGVAQMPRAPGTMFSRDAILAIIAAERTKWVSEPSIRCRAAYMALDALRRIFENLE